VIPLQQDAEEGVADAAGGDHPGDLGRGAGDRVQAELPQRLAVPGADGRPRLEVVVVVELVGKSLSVAVAGSDQPGVPGEFLHGRPGGGQLGERLLGRRPAGGEVLGPADCRHRRVGRALHAVGVIRDVPGLLGPLAGVA
jgi:hypothetical protein